jgi:hypothetical protein
MRTIFVIKKMTKVNNDPIGENSPNLVTLLVALPLPMYVRIGFFIGVTTHRKPAPADS